MKKRIKDILYLFLCIVIILLKLNFATKLVIGGILTILFSTFSQKKDKIVQYVYLKLLGFSCLIAMQFVFSYLQGEYLNIKNSVIIMIFMSSFVSIYILVITYIAFLAQKFIQQNYKRADDRMEESRSQ